MLICLHCPSPCTKPQTSISYSHVLQRTHRLPEASSPGTLGWWPASRWQRTACSWWSHTQQSGREKLGLLSHPLLVPSEPSQMGLCQPEAPHLVWEQQMGWAHLSTRLPGSRLSHRHQASTGENLCASAEHSGTRNMKDGSQSNAFHGGWKQRATSYCLLRNGHQFFTEQWGFYKSVGNAITNSLSLPSSQWDETDLPPIPNRCVMYPSQRIANGQLYTELLLFLGWVLGTWQESRDWHRHCICRPHVHLPVGGSTNHAWSSWSICLDAPSLFLHMIRSMELTI